MEEIPREWMQGLIFPLYKDGDDRDPLNYRGITLLSIVGKVYHRVLGDRLMKFAERKRCVRGTRNQTRNCGRAGRI
jgi:hypothetical protein